MATHTEAPSVEISQLKQELAQTRQEIAELRKKDASSQATIALLQHQVAELQLRQPTEIISQALSQIESKNIDEVELMQIRVTAPESKWMSMETEPRQFKLDFGIFNFLQKLC